MIVILMEEDQKGRNIGSADTSLQPEGQNKEKLSKEVEKKVKDQKDTPNWTSRGFTSAWCIIFFPELVLTRH